MKQITQIITLSLLLGSAGQLFGRLGFTVQNKTKLPISVGADHGVKPFMRKLLPGEKVFLKTKKGGKRCGYWKVINTWYKTGGYSLPVRLVITGRTYDMKTSFNTYKDKEAEVLASYKELPLHIREVEKIIRKKQEKKLKEYAKRGEEEFQKREEEIGKKVEKLKKEEREREEIKRKKELEIKRKKNLERKKKEAEKKVKKAQEKIKRANRNLFAILNVNNVTIWEKKKGGDWKKVKTLTFKSVPRGPGICFPKLLFSPNGKYIVCQREQYLQAIDLDATKWEERYIDNSYYPGKQLKPTFTFSPDGRYFFAIPKERGELLVWDAKYLGEEKSNLGVITMKIGTSRNIPFTFSPGGKYLFVSGETSAYDEIELIKFILGDKGAENWKRESICKKKIEDDAKLTSLKYVKDPKRGDTIIIKTNMGNCLVRLKNKRAGCYLSKKTATISPNGKLFVTSIDKTTFKKKEVEKTGKKIEKKIIDIKGEFSINSTKIKKYIGKIGKFSPNSRYLLTYDKYRKKINIWDTNEDKWWDKKHQALTNFLLSQTIFSPDSKYLAIGRKKQSSIIDMKAKKFIKKLKTPLENIKFNPGGEYLAVKYKSPYNKVEIWNTNTWKKELTIQKNVDFETTFGFLR